MNILILGSGGREHSLAWAIRQNPKCDRLIVAPGNAGTASIATQAQIDIADGAAVVAFARENDVDFVIIGPEAPLVAGVADAVRAAGILCFGPSAAAAQLEASKAFTKDICEMCAAPTARHATFDNQDAARAYVEAESVPIVIKADGLAAGKGVVVAQSLAQAEGALTAIFSGAFGAAGTQVVIEEFMPGEEASLFVLSDGHSVCPIGTAQDHKRRDEGDQGPNTGGMGAYSPAPVLSDGLHQKAMAEIIEPTLAEMARRGTPFQGVLYAGLMIHNATVRLVEYNVRFGDPECQVLMMRLGGQVLDLLYACAQGRLREVSPQWADDHAMTVVMAADGYPGVSVQGGEIRGLSGIQESSTEMIFHAGTNKGHDGTITAVGGRVLNATGRGDTLEQARARAYALAAQVDWPDGVYRRDIGWRALKE